MRTSVLLFGLAAILAGAAACGGSVVGTGGGGTGTGAGATTGTGAGATTGTGAGSTTGTTGTTSTGTSSSGGPCPPSPPAAGDTCDTVPSGFRCTYGTSTRPDCREVWQCIDDTWNSSHSACAMTTGCPSTQPAQSSVCSMSGGVNEICTFGDSLCICNDCAEGLCMSPPIEWQCAGPPTTAGCPPVVPNDGTPCSDEGVMCTYGLICSMSGALVSCKNGLWLWNTMIACGG